MSKKGRLLVLSGPSGVGKDTVIRAYLKKHPEMKKSISATTRAPRGQEKDGVNYFFVTKEQFETMKKEGKLLEHAVYNDNYYGTPKQKVLDCLAQGNDVVLVIEVQGALQIMQNCPKALFVFLMPPSKEELAHRLEKRATDSEAMIAKRLQTAEWEIQQAEKYDFVIINHSVEETLTRLEEIMKNGK